MKDLNFKKKPRYEEIQDEIQALPGMKSIKQQVENLVSQAIVNKARKAAGLETDPFSNHMVLVGSPGTGKTTVTKKLGELMFELGLVSNSEVVQLSRKDLVGEFVNTAAKTTNEIITENRGKVIFIDEAYTLFSGPGDREGRQVVDELMRLAEEYRGDTAIVLAGYEKEMDGLLDANPGLKSRFSNRMVLPDYTPDEKVRVLDYIVASANREFADRRAHKQAQMHVASMKTTGDSGNARAVRNFYDALREAHARRIAADPRGVDAKALQTFTSSDVAAAAAKMNLPQVVKVRPPAKPKAPPEASRKAYTRRRRTGGPVVEKPGMALVR